MRKKALITGASSGIGRDIAIVLSRYDYDLIVVARREQELQRLKESLTTDVQIKVCDLSKKDECYRLYDEVKGQKIEMLINNAGCGFLGSFNQTDLKNELEMIDLNIKAVHILTKLFLKDFVEKNEGYILNVASSGAFLAGPLFSSYYASKAYILRLTQAVHEELRQEKSQVYIGALCPGPVKTEFDKRAGVKMSLNGLSSMYVSKYAVKKMFQRKMTIVPSFTMKLVYLFDKFAPTSILLRITYSIQKKKINY